MNRTGRIGALGVALAAALVAAHSASALRAQIGDPLALFPEPGIGPRTLWLEEDLSAPGDESSWTTIGSKADGSPGAVLRDEKVALTPGLPLLLDNCGRLPFTDERELTCSGPISDVWVAAWGGDDGVFLNLPVPGRLEGGTGNDRLRGGPVADRVDGGPGSDDVFGGKGDDALFASLGTGDVVWGDEGNDSLVGGLIRGVREYEDDYESRDTLRGGHGNDTLLAVRGDDLDGGDGADVLQEPNSLGVLFQGHDTMLGGAGDDTLLGGWGADVLDGGAGNDLLNGGTNADTIAGGSGIDTVDYTSFPPLIVILDGLANDHGGDNVAIDVENVLGSAGDDVLRGSSLGNRLSGNSGNDSLLGEAGADSLLGGAGDDVLGGGSGNDQLSGHAGADRLHGGLGGDVLNGGDGDDLIDARDGLVDRVTCGAGTDEARVDAVDIVTPGCERVVRAK